MTATAARVSQRAASVGAGRGGPGRAGPGGGVPGGVAPTAVSRIMCRCQSPRDTRPGAAGTTGDWGSIPGCQRTTERRKVAREAASTNMCMCLALSRQTPPAPLPPPPSAPPPPPPQSAFVHASSD